MPLIVPNGRVYAFYDYNGNDVRALPDQNQSNPRRHPRVVLLQVFRRRRAIVVEAALSAADADYCLRQGQRLGRKGAAFLGH